MRAQKDSWVERRARKEDQQEEPRKRAQKRKQEKEKPPASIEGKLILEGGKILR